MSSSATARAAAEMRRVVGGGLPLVVAKCFGEFEREFAPTRFLRHVEVDARYERQEQRVYDVAHTIAMRE